MTDKLQNLRGLTPARLRLDASGGPTPLSSVLDFQASHARARDPIHTPVDWSALEEAIGPGETIRVNSEAETRDIYVRRPDLGRRLRAADLSGLPPGPFDVVIVVADGLSARAIDRHAARMADGLNAEFTELTVAPVVLAEQGRVAIGDGIGAAMTATLVTLLIGERPGLSVTDSLGAYLTLNPRIGTPDSARNCVSNIHENGGCLTRPRSTKSPGSLGMR